MIRDAGELASVCDELFAPDFQKAWAKLQASIPVAESLGSDGVVRCSLSLYPPAESEAPNGQWEAVVAHCNAFVRSFGSPRADNVADKMSQGLAEIVLLSLVFGGKAQLRRSEILQTCRAREAKRRKGETRGQIIRQAILAVCQREKLIPVASEKFASSIRSHVIRAADEFGAVDPSSGTSVRSIQRHIAGMLKDPRM